MGCSGRGNHPLPLLQSVLLLQPIWPLLRPNTNNGQSQAGRSQDPLLSRPVEGIFPKVCHLIGWYAYMYDVTVLATVDQHNSYHTVDWCVVTFFSYEQLLEEMRTAVKAGQFGVSQQVKTREVRPVGPLSLSSDLICRTVFALPEKCDANSSSFSGHAPLG